MLKKLLSYVFNNMVLFGVISVLLLIPNYPSYLVPLKRYSLKIMLPSILVSFLYIAIIAGVLCILSELIKKYNKKIWKFYIVIIHIILYVVSFVELCCILLFHNQFEPHLLQLINETNTQEASEFFTTYILQLKFFLILFFYIFIGILEFLLYKVVEKYPYVKKVLKIGFIVIFIGLVINAFMFSGHLIKKNDEDLKRPHLEVVKANFFLRLYRSVKGFYQTKEEAYFSEIVHENISIDSCSYKSKNIVLIIGESHSKYHSSLYGYYNNTNPMLSEYDSLLFVYNNVISPANLTSDSFKSFLSFQSSDNKEINWYSFPFFPALFKQAGYNVVFYSNQFVKNVYNDNWDFICGHFLENNNINKACFTYRNDKKYKYDGDMVDTYIKERDLIEKDSLNLIIFHLFGQHSSYKHRYPQEFEYFSADSINRPDLSRIKREKIAYYDNATRYNDYVVDKIISLYKDKDALVIYFSDHSEEVYDFRDFNGRSHNLYTYNANILRYQLDVPFFVYVSDKYKKNNPDIVKALERSTDKPYMIDDLPHFMLDLSGIKVKYYNPEKSLLNDKYKRKRIIGNNMDYDYDEICK